MVKVFRVRNICRKGWWKSLLVPLAITKSPGRQRSFTSTSRAFTNDDDADSDLWCTTSASLPDIYSLAAPSLPRTVPTKRRASTTEKLNSASNAKGRNRFESDHRRSFNVRRCVLDADADPKRHVRKRAVTSDLSYEGVRTESFDTQSLLRDLIAEADPENVHAILQSRQNMVWGTRRARLLQRTAGIMNALAKITKSLWELRIQSTSIALLLVDLQVDVGEARVILRELRDFYSSTSIEGSFGHRHEGVHMARKFWHELCVVEKLIDGSIANSITSQGSDYRSQVSLQARHRPQNSASSTAPIVAGILTYRVLVEEALHRLEAHESYKQAKSDPIRWLTHHYTRSFHKITAMLNEIKKITQLCRRVLRHENKVASSKHLRRAVNSIVATKEDLLACIEVYRLLLHERLTRTEPEQLRRMVERAQTVERERASTRLNALEYKSEELAAEIDMIRKRSSD